MTAFTLRPRLSPASMPSSMSLRRVPPSLGLLSTSCSKPFAPTPFEPPDPCIVTGQSSSDIFFDTIGPQGTHHYDLDVQANQSLVISAVQVSTGSLDFGFALLGGSIDPNSPIVTMTLTGTFDPVPEPSTFVIFVGLGGLGLVGYLGRRCLSRHF